MNKLSLSGFALFLAGCLALGSVPASGAEALAPGDSTLTRQQVKIALHIPPALERVHGPSGVWIFFGGVGDSIEGYQKKLGPIADALDLALVIPQMPWFKEPGTVQPRGVYTALKQTVNEIEKQFKTDPRLVVIGGASAGGSPAHELARSWSPKVAFLLLSSTGPFPDVSKPRTFHVVAQKELDRLGPQGRSGAVLGKGRKDLFAIPGGSHSAQIKHLKVWLETEMASLRLDKAQETIRAAEERLRKGETEQAKELLQSTLDAIALLDQPVPEEDAFFQYQAKERQELRTKYAPAIKSLETIQAKMSSQPQA